MKAKVCLAALCFLIFHCSAADGQTPKKNDQSAEWEYKQLSSPSDELLNHYAKDGWEIAAAAGGGGDMSSFYWVILKRSKSHPLFGTQTPELLIALHFPLPKNQQCKLTLAQAPVIRGLRLGMTSDELFAIFPANDREEFDRAQQLKSAELPPSYGYTHFQFNPSNYPTKDRFTGVGYLNIGLFDKKVVSYKRYLFEHASIRSHRAVDGNHYQAIRFTGIQGLAGLQRKLGTLEQPVALCDGFTFQVYAGRGSFSISLTDPTYKKIADERKQADLAKKREGIKF